MALDTKFDQAPVRRYDYDDRTLIAVDFGPAVDPVVDVVDGTAILILDGRQREIDLPTGEVEVFNRNGVVTLEVAE